MEKEIREPSSLLDERGELIQVGWARQPLLDCNLERVAFYAIRPLQTLRIKGWDYYAVFTPTHFFSVTVADIGYVGNVFAYVIDLETGEFHEESMLIPLAWGVKLPRNSTEGDVVFDNGRVRMAFRLEGEKRRVLVDWPGWKRGEGLSSDIMLHCPPDHESIVIATPIGRKRFFYSRKMACLPAEGWFQKGSQRFTLEPQSCLGGLDWGRGVWEYRSFWNWASVSAYLPDGRRLGLNMGGGFGDTSRVTDNCIMLEGRVHKLHQVVWEYDTADYMKPWRFVNPEGRLELTFAPFFERVAKSNVLLVSSEVHQLFGRYSGRLVTDEGEVIEVRDVVGFAEEHHARW